MVPYNQIMRMRESGGQDHTGTQDGDLSWPCFAATFIGFQSWGTDYAHHLG